MLYMYFTIVLSTLPSSMLLPVNFCKLSLHRNQLVDCKWTLRDPALSSDVLIDAQSSHPVLTALQPDKPRSILRRNTQLQSNHSCRALSQPQCPHLLLAKSG